MADNSSIGTCFSTSSLGLLMLSSYGTEDNSQSSMLDESKTISREETICDDLHINSPNNYCIGQQQLTSNASVSELHRDTASVAPCIAFENVDKPLAPLASPKMDFEDNNKTQSVPSAVVTTVSPAVDVSTISPEPTSLSNDVPAQDREIIDTVDDISKSSVQVISKPNGTIIESNCTTIILAEEQCTEPIDEVSVTDLQNNGSETSGTNTGTTDLASTPKESEEVVTPGIYFIDRASRKNPYIEDFSADSESDSESSSGSSESNVVSSSSDSSSSSSEEELVQRKKANKPAGTQKIHPPCSLKTKGEISIEDLPPIEDLQITVPEEDIHKIGHVRSIVGTQVVIESFKNEQPLDLDSVLFLSNGKSLGKVFDVFGQVVCPLYSVRFNCKEDIEAHEVQIGDPIFSAPTHPEVTSFVFTEKLKEERGSDASGMDNNEIPDEFRDFSDDEEERRFRQKLRGKHTNSANEEETTGCTPTRKPRVQGSNGLPPKHFLRPQRFQLRSNGFPNRPDMRPQVNSFEQWHQSTPHNPAVFSRAPLLPNRFQFRGPPPNFDPHIRPPNCFSSPHPNPNFTEPPPTFRPAINPPFHPNSLPQALNHQNTNMNGFTEPPSGFGPPNAPYQNGPQHPGLLSNPHPPVIRPPHDPMNNFPQKFNPQLNIPSRPRFDNFPQPAPPPRFGTAPQIAPSPRFGNSSQTVPPSGFFNNNIHQPKMNTDHDSSLRFNNPFATDWRTETPQIPSATPVSTFSQPVPTFQQQSAPPQFNQANNMNVVNNQNESARQQLYTGPSFPLANVQPQFGGSPVFTNHSQAWNQEQNNHFYEPCSFVTPSSHRPQL